MRQIQKWAEATAVTLADAREKGEAGVIVRIERSYGSFARTFALPPTVDAGKVSAQYKAGVLTVRLPMREEAKPNKIKVAVEA